MNVTRNRTLIVAILALLPLSLAVLTWPQGFPGAHHDAFEPRFEATHDEPRAQPQRGEELIRGWNEIALIANALDHTSVAPDENRVFGEQFGPCRTSRAFAIVHIAIFDAVNAIAGGYQIAVQIADQLGTHAVELARLLALVNVALADTGIAVWKSKYVYDYWRPITGIREAHRGGNPATVRDRNYTPLGAPASNLDGPNFTPPFPAYPSGHAGFGAALFETLRNFYRTDHIAFTFVSDEFNGVTQDNAGTVRPRLPRSFSSLSEAEEENGQSRIYLGIHWAFDKTAASPRADTWRMTCFKPRSCRRAEPRAARTEPSAFSRFRNLSQSSIGRTGSQVVAALLVADRSRSRSRRYRRLCAPELGEGQALRH